MNDFITLSTILLLIPLNFMLIYNLLFQLKQTFNTCRLQSILYTFLLAILVTIVSYLIFEILFTENILTEPRIVI